MNRYGHAALDNPALGFSLGEDDAAQGILNELIQLADLPSPAHQMLRLDALAWWLVRYSASRLVQTLWKKIETLAARSTRVSLRWWTIIVEYLGERIGGMLYRPTSSSRSSDSFQKQNTDYC